MSDLVIDDHGGWLVATLNRPARRNALSPGILAGLHDALAQARAGGHAAMVVAGAGGYFCAGGDLDALRERRALPLAGRVARIEALHDVIRALRHAPCPVIAATGRGAAGAGLSLALACDLVVADQSARFGLAYVRAGLTPDGGVLTHLAQALPRATVARLALFGDPVGAARLHDLGVVSDLAHDGGSLALAQGLAARLADGPRQAQAAIRALIAPPDAGFEAALARERDAMARALGGDEAATRIAAMRDGRAGAGGGAGPAGGAGGGGP